MTTQRANYVEITATSEAAVLSAGMTPRAPATPIGELPAPQNVTGTTGDQDGEVDLAWNRVRGAKSYIVDCKLYTETAWEQCAVVTNSRATLSGLESGKKYAFRVRAVGAAGAGAWSDDTVVMAP